MQCTTRYLKLIDLESTFSKKGNTNQRVLKGLSVLMYLPYKITIAYLLSLHKKKMKIVASTGISISSIFYECSMLQQMQSRRNHTSYKNFHFNEFVANAFCDNIRYKKSASNLIKELRLFFCF